MYNKIFTKILDSSVWLEPHATRIVWVTMIAAMDEDGFCAFASIRNLANRAMVSSEEATAALATLEGPDVDSSDVEHDGRRLERVPGGWLVLNSSKYRNAVTRSSTLQATRDRVRRHREKKKAEAAGAEKQPISPEIPTVTPCNKNVTPSEADTEAEAVPKQEQKQTQESARAVLELAPAVEKPNLPPPVPPKLLPIKPSPFDSPAFRASATPVNATQVDMSDLVNAIVCAHPKALQRAWTARDVPYSAQTETLSAIEAEVEKTGCSAQEAAAFILERLRFLAEKVPRGEWRYFKPPDVFMRLREYRLEPEEFYRPTTAAEPQRSFVDVHAEREEEAIRKLRRKRADERQRPA